MPPRSGMWLFLVTEIMFFGGMFSAYLVYRYMYYGPWLEGSQHMDFWWGTINTAVLICSSLTMALGVRASQDRSAQDAGHLPADHDPVRPGVPWH